MKSLFFILCMFMSAGAFSQACTGADTATGNNVTLITATSARVNADVDNSGPGSGFHIGCYLVYVRVGHTDTVTVSTPSITNGLVNLTGLSAGTAYRYYYRTVCASNTVNQMGVYTFTTLGSTIVYKPEYQPYQWGYGKFDSSLAIPNGDTSIGRAPPSLAQIKYKASNNTFYGYYPSCLCWRPLAIDSAGIIGLLNDKVDSVTVSGDSLFYWKVGVAYGYILPTADNFDATVDFSVNADPNTGGTTFSPNTPELTTKIYVSTIDGSQWTWSGVDYKLYTSVGWRIFGNSGLAADASFLGTTDSVDLVIKTKGIERARFNARGALGLGSGTDYGTSGYALITNGSSTVPTWHNIQDGWFNIVRDGGADTTGATDVSTIFVNAMAAGWRNFFVPKGSFLISNQIQMHDSVTIKGAGRFSTIFKLTTDIAAFKCAIPSGGNQCTFSDIGFYGTYATGGGTSQIGISIDTAQKILIKSISGTNIGGFVVNILRNGYNGPYIDIAGKSNEITDSYFEANYGGVNFGTRGEYNTISNSTFTQNLYAIYNVAGNSRINGNTCVNNTYGLYMASGSNNGHGVATGNTFNHNGGGGVGANIYLSNLSSGFSFVNNTWVQSRNANAGLIEIVSCANVYFYGGFTSNDTVRTTGCTNIAFDNVNPYLVALSPVWVNVSGDAPTVSYIGRIQNTFSLRDVANAKQLDITQTNAKVNFTGTSGIKFGFLNAAADSTVDITGSLKASGGVRFTGLIAGLADTTTYKPVGISSSGTLASMASWPVGSGGGSGITVGTTTITSGTNGRIGYNNAGVYGEYPITGTGNVMLSASPTTTGTLTATAITASGNLTVNTLTSGRIPLISTSGLLFDNAGLTWTNSDAQVNLTTTSTTGGFNLTGGNPRYNITATNASNAAGYVMNNSGAEQGSLFIGGAGMGAPFTSAVGFFINAAGGFKIYSAGTSNTTFEIAQATGLIKMPAYGAGTATFDASGNITSVSDERLKTNIKPYTSGLRELLLLKPIQYQWNDKSGNETKGTYAGFSAQNVKSAIPYGTGENKDGYLSLQDRPLIATLVNAVKEQQQQIEELKREIIKLQQK